MHTSAIHTSAIHTYLFYIVRFSVMDEFFLFGIWLSIAACDLLQVAITCTLLLSDTHLVLSSLKLPSQGMLHTCAERLPLG